MADPHGPLNWPPAGPMFTDEKDKDYSGGHPTSPGPREKFVARRSQVEDQGNGRPGRPRYKALPQYHGKWGSIIVGPTPSGPKAPGVQYDDGSNE